jgi:D-arginine dehydrogenase
MPETFDIAVIGAGIAGASAAWACAEHGRVVLIEREDQPGFHSTSRSAASFSLGHFEEIVRRLSAASLPFLAAPPDGFSWAPLLSPRPILYVATGAEVARLEAHRLDLARHVPDLEVLPPSEALALCPVLAPDVVGGALLEPSAWEMDVHGLLHGFLSGLRARGGTVVLDAPVTALDRLDGAWTIRTPSASLRADVVVDAAGAWGDRVAAMAGCRPLDLAILKRSAVLVEAGDGVRAWPMVKVLGDVLYVKPDGGRLMVSPMDEVPEEAGDAHATAQDVALAMDRLLRYTTLRPDHVPHRWAGHRTFAPDRRPVAGFDPVVPGFFWLVGQGGAGVKTAAALARTAAVLLASLPFPEDLSDLGITPDALSPRRFR